MQPDRGIVRTYRRSDSLSAIPDDQNTLTCQFCPETSQIYAKATATATATATSTVYQDHR